MLSALDNSWGVLHLRCRGRESFWHNLGAISAGSRTVVSRVQHNGAVACEGLRTEAGRWLDNITGHGCVEYDDFGAAGWVDRFSSD